MNISRIYDIYRDACDGKVTTDTRTIKGGELFIALKGENFDGNQFVGKALELGALYAIADRSCGDPDPRIIKVDDTLATLWELARWHREHLNVPTLGQNGVMVGGNRLTVISLTGTNGKTTTKELIRAVLSTHFKVSATEGNLNNNIGVPLTILKMNEETELALVEMGASHPGDINELVVVAHPDIGLITNVGKAHLLGFGSFEGVKATKGELYDYLLAHGWKKVFVNVDNPHLCEMTSLRPGLEEIPYGVKYQDVTVLPSDNEHPFLRLVVSGRTINTQLVGAYNADNVLAAIAVGDWFGIGLEDAASAIEAYTPSNNRSQMVRTERNTLIVDAYNANPSSMDAALDNFALVESSRKLALLGGMRELGAESAAEHLRIAQKAVAVEGAEVCFVGEEFAAAAQALAGDRVRWFDTSASLAAFLHDNPVSGATVLVKGSRGIKMETVIPEL